jgi:hypothetical protein
MDEGKLRGEQDRGAKAEALLRNPILQETFNSLSEMYIDTWKATSVEQDAQREKIFQMYQALEAVRGHLEEMVSTGELAKLELSNNNSLWRR